MADEIEIIRSRISIVDLVGQSVALKKAGRAFKGLCPFHADRNPSMTVSPDIGRYKCWSCGAGGDIFNWVMESQKVDFPEALRILAEQAGVELKARAPGEGAKDKKLFSDIMKAAQDFFVRQLDKSSEAKEYCQARGLDESVRGLWGLGYGPENGEALVAALKRQGFSLAEAEALFLVQSDESRGFRDRFRSRLTIPIHDDRGRPVAYGGRIIGQGMPKYINSSDTPLFHKSNVLYGLHAAKDHISKSGYAVLVEGYMDVIACHRAGVVQAVASLGTSLTEEQIKLMKRWCERVVVLYDRDEAGQKAAEKAVDMLLDQRIHASVAMPPPGEDPDSLLQAKGGGAVQELVEKALSPAAHRLARLNERLSPSSPTYWDEAADALALCRNRLELEEHLGPLAASYPNARDRTAAMNAVRSMAMTAAKNRKRRRSDEPDRIEAAESRPKPPARLVLPMHQIGLEGTILRALFVPHLVKAAWQACLEPGLLRPGSAETAGRAIAEAFPSAHPAGRPMEWVNQIADEAVKDLLMALLEHGADQLRRTEPTPPSAEEFLAAVERLRNLRHDRQVDPAGLADKNDDELRALVARLQNRKGRPPAPKEDDGLF